MGSKLAVLLSHVAFAALYFLFPVERLFKNNTQNCQSENFPLGDIFNLFVLAKELICSLLPLLSLNPFLSIY